MNVLVMGISLAIGFGAGYACFKAQIDVQKANHKQETAEARDEIGRLRTQVAKWVGTERAV